MGVTSNDYEVCFVHDQNALGLVSGDSQIMVNVMKKCIFQRVNIIVCDLSQKLIKIL